MRTRSDSPTKNCTLDGCEKPLRARGMCATHYNATFHHGSQRRANEDLEKRRTRLRERTRRRRAIARGAEAEIIDLDKMAARDGWRCFCRRRVNPDLRYPHPRSATIDHIIPLSQGGSHTYANSRLAHWDCNVKRGNRGGNEQLVLLG